MDDFGPRLCVAVEGSSLRLVSYVVQTENGGAYT